MDENPRALGGRILTKPFLFLSLLFLIGVAFAIARFAFGLGAVSNLSGGYPWGLWIGMDVVVGTAFGCGGFSMAVLVYVFNRRRYHALMRPALMASLFGYTLAGVSVLIDLGRYWHAYNLALPWYAQPHSILFEVAVCIGAYVVVLLAEFSPTFLEHFRMTKALAVVRRFMFALVALGVLLPMMHQSSLGSMLLVMGSQLSPLWYSSWLPLLYLLTALTMGYGVVMCEATLVARTFHLPSEQKILGRISPIVAALLAVFLVVRFADIAARGHIGLVFAGDRDSLFFLTETALFLLAALLLASPGARRSPRLMFLAAAVLLAGGTLYRLDGYLIAYAPGNGWTYFPSVGEFMITIALFSFEIMLYLVFIKKLPVLSGLRTA